MGKCQLSAVTDTHTEIGIGDILVYFGFLILIIVAFQMDLRNCEH